MPLAMFAIVRSNALKNTHCLRIAGPLVLVHSPVIEELKITMFRKLRLFPYSADGVKRLLCWGS
jgi:hypothetical protein